MPVKSIAMPASFAASITSWSRIEPPGWMTEVIPILAAASIPSLKGKKASDAAIEYLIFEDSSVFNVRSNEGFLIDLTID